MNESTTSNAGTGEPGAGGARQAAAGGLDLSLGHLGTRTTRRVVARWAERLYDHAAGRSGLAWYRVEIAAGWLAYTLDPWPIRPGCK